MQLKRSQALVRDIHFTADVEQASLYRVTPKTQLRRMYTPISSSFHG